MKSSKFFDFLVGILIILIFLVFNPFVFPTLYFDATLSYGFVATAKVLLLAILNIVLIVKWIQKVRSDGALLLPPVKIYFVFILWIVSIVLSYITSIDKANSFFGYNFTLENSLIESVLLIILFISFISTYDTSERIMRLIRYIGAGISLLAIYTLIRQNFDWSISNALFENYLNSKLFSPSGNFSSLILIFLCGFLLSAGNLVYGLVIKNEQALKLIDTVNASLSLITFVYLLHLGDGRYIQMFYLISGIISIGLLVFIVFSNERFSKYNRHLLALIFIPAILGIVIYFYGVRPAVPPTVPFEYNWAISVESLKAPIHRAVFGNGQSNFAYYFDQFKGETIVLPQLDENKIYRTPFKINDQAPAVPELRVYQNNSQMFNILSSQGLFGIIVYISIFILVAYHSFKKGLLNNGLFPVLTLSCFSIIFLGSLFYRYDFILNFLFWIVLAVHLIVLYEDEPRKALTVSLGHDFSAKHDKYRFILPILSISFVLILSIYTLPVFVEKYYLYNAKNAQLKNEKQAVFDNSQKAALSLPISSISMRELVQYEFNEINSEYIELNRKVREDPKFIETEEYKAKKTNLALRIENSLRILSTLSQSQNLEYKNFYMAGLILTKLSPYNDLAFDTNAEKYLRESLVRNPENPNIYYYLAQIYHRNNNRVNASNYISRAVRIFPDNILYLALQADILYSNGDYENALDLYKKIKNFIASQNNEQLNEIYRDENIELNIKNTEEQIRSKTKD